MISLRYHLASLTAVFLALGLGIAIGSTLIGRVTVGRLESSLDDIEALERENDGLQGELDEFASRDEQFEAEVEEPLVAERLSAVPVLVVALDGVDETARDAAHQTLLFAGADLAATIVVSRDSEPAAMQALGEVLADANEPQREPKPPRERVAPTTTLGDQATVDPSAGAVPTTIETSETAPPPAEPSPTTTLLEVPVDTTPNLAEVVEVGQGDVRFNELEAVVDEFGLKLIDEPLVVELDSVLADNSGLRIVVVWDDDPTVDQGLVNAFLEPLIDDADGSSRGPFAGVVLAQLTEESAPAEEAASSLGPLGSIRQREQRPISTVDNLSTSLGRLALILALDDLADRKTGHYGTALDADRLVPR